MAFAVNGTNGMEMQRNVMEWKCNEMAFAVRSAFSEAMLGIC